MSDRFFDFSQKKFRALVLLFNCSWPQFCCLVVGKLWDGPNQRREIGIGRAQRHGDGFSPGLFLIVPLGPQVQRDIDFRVVRGLTAAGEAPSSKAVRRNLGSRARIREV